MKKFNFAKIVSLIFVCAMLMGALTIAALAAGEDDVVIASNNVYYGEKYQIMYAIKAPEGATITATDSKGNAVAIIPFEEEPTVTLNGVQYNTYVTKGGVAAQAIDEVITITVEANGKTATQSYSVLQYIYERMYVKNIAEGKELAMLEALLEYADAANAFLDGATVSFSEYKYVTVVDGTLDGNNTAGMFPLGATPFANVTDTLEYIIEEHHVEWDVTVDGGESTRYQDITNLEVTGNMTLKAVLVVNPCQHNFLDATCTEPATCSKCGETTGEALGHIWDDATCTAPKTCTVCDATEGEALGHTWTDATCQTPKTCSVCEATEGEVAECSDNNENGRCDTCDTILTYLEVTITEAIELADNTPIKVTGTVIRIDTAYSSQYDNISVTIKDENGGELFLFRLTGNVDVGAIIKVTGTMSTYNNARQVAQGATFEIVGTHECTEFTEATCTEAAKCVLCGQTTGELAEHNIVAGVCTVCGLAEGVSTSENKYTFSEYTVGTQYAEETHKLDDTTELYIIESHLNGELRIYSSDAHPGVAILKSTISITKIAVNAGYKVDTLVVYGSNDEGATWAEVARISVTSTSYKDYEADLGGSYKWIKLDVAGTQQVRLKSITLTTINCAHANTEDVKAVDATCTTAGKTAGTVCSDCGQVVDGMEVVPATGHLNDIVLEAVDATCTGTGLTAGVKCSACGEITTPQTEIPATGEHNDGDGNGSCDVCGTDMNTDEAKAQAVLAGLAAPKDNATSDGEGITLDTSNSTGYEATIKWAITGGTNSGSQIDGNELVVTLNDNESTIVLTVSVTVGEATATESFTISVAAGKKEPTTLATFEFGANGSASHADGTKATSYSETVNGYTLEMTGTCYTGARDAKGNSCIKLGTSSSTGSFTFTVEADVTSVVIYVAKYKANTTKITVNGTSYTISGASNDGAYDAITVDTTTTKTVSFATVSGGVRCMIDAIEFIG